MLEIIVVFLARVINFIIYTCRRACVYFFLCCIYRVVELLVVFHDVALLLFAELVFALHFNKVVGVAGSGYGLPTVTCLEMCGCW